MVYCNIEMFNKEFADELIENQRKNTNSRNIEY